MTRSIRSRRSQLVYAAAGFSMLLAASAARAADRSEGSSEATALLAEQICAPCHGAHGASTVSEFPSLAAQQQAYIAAKLKQFRNQARRRPERHQDLLGVTVFDDATIEALSRYFADQPAPQPVTRNAAAIDAGGRIYNGLTDRKGVAACARCHGPNAEGNWIVPRLGGQQAPYVERQLRLIQLQLRRTPVIHGMAKDLSPEDIRSVAAFVQSK